MEHFIELSKVLGPWCSLLLSVVGTVLATLLHTGIKEIRKLKDTEIKAELAYDEVSKRVPEVKMKYDFWEAHR